MTKIVSVHSYRAGTGKSNLIANFATAIALQGHRVAVVDTDIQSPGVHIIFGLDEQKISKTLNDYLWGHSTIEEAAYDVSSESVMASNGRIFLIPSSVNPDEITRILREGYEFSSLSDGLCHLVRSLSLDYLFIDTHPGLNKETLLSITISNLLILILRPDQQDFQGTTVTVEIAKQLKVPKIMLVVNKALPNTEFAALRQQIETTYQVPVAGILPLSEDIAQLASRQIFYLQYPDHPISREIQQIAMQIINSPLRDEPDLDHSSASLLTGTGKIIVAGQNLKSLASSIQAAASPFQSYLNKLHQKYQSLREGTVANYIPELAKANPDWFGICVATVDGRVYEVGDYQQLFTIQSISKVFVYGLALEDRGRDYVSTKVGVEPTGEDFNSIMLDEKSNRPYNPMVNAGAIATADLIQGNGPTERLNRLLQMFQRYTGRDVFIDMPVYMSERTTGNRNRAMAYLMLNFGMVSHKVEETLDLYFQQCSVLVNCHNLAIMAATLANGGINPITNNRAIDSSYIQDLLSLMYTCGMYNYSGEWAYKVGIPAKSGVGGGILAVVPQKLGIGIFSPLLDERGNSARGIKVCEELSQEFGLHPFNATQTKHDLTAFIEG